MVLLVWGCATPLPCEPEPIPFQYFEVWWGMPADEANANLSRIFGEPADVGIQGFFFLDREYKPSLNTTWVRVDVEPFPGFEELSAFYVEGRLAGLQMSHNLVDRKDHNKLRLTTRFV